MPLDSAWALITSFLPFGTVKLMRSYAFAIYLLIDFADVLPLNDITSHTTQFFYFIHASMMSPFKAIHFHMNHTPYLRNYHRKQHRHQSSCTDCNPAHSTLDLADFNRLRRSQRMTACTDGNPSRDGIVHTKQLD